MKTYGNIVAGGVEFPLMEMEVQYTSLAREGSGRDAEGEMHIEWIRERIRKVKCKLPPTRQTDVQTYLNAVMGKIYSLEYIDPIDGLKTIQVYTSEINASMYNARLEGGLWHNITFNAIEV